MNKVKTNTAQDAILKSLMRAVMVGALIGGGGIAAYAVYDILFCEQRFKSFSFLLCQENASFGFYFGWELFGLAAGAIGGLVIWVIIRFLVPAIFRLGIKVIIITAFLVVITAAAGALLSPIVAAIGALLALGIGLQLEGEDHELRVVSSFPFLFFAVAYFIIYFDDFWISLSVACSVLLAGAIVAEVVEKIAEWVEDHPFVGFFSIAGILLFGGLSYLAYMSQ